jgi:hypothetical protein
MKNGGMPTYAVPAVALLRRAQAANYFGDGGHVHELKTDPDFAALRNRADFAEMVRDLAKGTP